MSVYTYESESSEGMDIGGERPAFLLACMYDHC